MVFYGQLLNVGLWLCFFLAGSVADWVDDMSGFSSDAHRSFLNWMVQTVNPQLVVDMGFNFGHTTYCLSSEMLLQRNSGSVLSIDNLHLLSVASDKAKKHGLTNVEFVNGVSSEIALEWNKSFIDILLFNGISTEVDLADNFILWTPLIERNGVLLFDNVFKPNSYFATVVDNDFLYQGYFASPYGLGVATNNKHFFNLLSHKYEQSFVSGKNVEIGQQQGFLDKLTASSMPPLHKRTPTTARATVPSDGIFSKDHKWLHLTFKEIMTAMDLPYSPNKMEVWSVVIILLFFCNLCVL